MDLTTSVRVTAHHSQSPPHIQYFFQDQNKSGAAKSEKAVLQVGANASSGTLNSTIYYTISSGLKLTSSTNRFHHSLLAATNDYGRPTRSHLPCQGPELAWVTDHLLLPDHIYGTVCRQICA